MDRYYDRIPIENRQHGNLSFPAALYEWKWTLEERSVGLHWHKEAEFFYVEQGTARFQIGKNTFSLNEGEAAFVHGGEVHAAHEVGASDCTFFAFVFDLSLLQGLPTTIHTQYIAPLIAGERTLPAHITSDLPYGKAVLKTLRKLKAAFVNQADGYDLECTAHLMYVLSQVAKDGGFVQRGHANAEQGKLEQLKAVMLFIEEQFARRIKLSELADIAHMSEAHFCRFFKAIVKQTPMQYVNHVRVQHAANLLRTTERKTLAVAMESGFENLSYFNRKFKEMMGDSPAEYRRGSRTKL
ncbi:helix-turn-helix transcriptional regulator [Aureibacillus halotolerans]|uniref:AraC-like DNA-binding protein n=1 Tax=Aureibacillus halotolerans TaxID=1508390 RepID=A0A4R6TW28_9BACI|nr:AraC family transcriptional regulator [Aureibacillus halotolerans]TDQ36443.1 AraC-like DNA-binding protein [Aureibacillus halotolerans]